MPVEVLEKGDIIVIYRTKDDQGPAEYRSVATSVCVVEEVKDKKKFRTFEEFYEYANTYSIFDKEALKYWYNKGACYTIRMTYNAALQKRLTRQTLVDKVGISRKERWSFLELTSEQFELILEKGDISEGIIIY